MPDFLTDNIEIYSKLQNVYQQTVYDSLKSPTEQLTKLFLQLLAEKDSEYSLLSHNSVYPSKYYQVKDRIKKDDSFYEKLIRKDIGLHFTNKFSLLEHRDFIEEQKAQIVAEIQKIDDLIGLRIVTELKKDCKNVYKLLLNSPEFFQRHSITFSDLSSQPQNMQNGLEIYRIKGKFQGLYYFELQIKSKIDEAWGDMDHSLFYKDYSVSPIKDTVQATMNNVGGLLDKIEKLLFDLRESGANYRENAEHLEFQQILENEVSDLLYGYFKVPYKLKDIIPFLKFFKDKFGNGKVLVDIPFSHLNWNVNDAFCSNYILIRNGNHNLIVIESLYYAWKQLYEDNFMLSIENYENELKSFLILFNEFISSNLQDDQGDVNVIIEHLTKYCKSAAIFLKPSDLKKAQDICKVIDNILIEEEIDEEEREIIGNCFRIVYYNGNVSSYLEVILEENDISNEIIVVRDRFEGKETMLESIIYQCAARCLEEIRKIQNL